MAKTYLVTGGAGFLGAAIALRLVREGHRVRVLDNLSRGKASRLSRASGIDFIEADIRDASAVEKAARGVDSVLHLAYVNGTEHFYREPERVLDVGVKGIVNVLDACLRCGVGELVLASSSEVYQDPPRVPTDEGVPLSIPDPLNARMSYAAGKILGEVMALAYGRSRISRVLVFRPHNVYGPDMGEEHVLPQFVRRVKGLLASKEDPLPFPIQGTGKETRSFLYVADLVEGVRLMMEKGEHRGIYHVGTSEELEVRRVAEMVGEHFGRRIRVVPGPLAPGSPLRRCPDISKLSALGFRPRVTLKEGLPRLAEWYAT